MTNPCLFVWSSDHTKLQHLIGSMIPKSLNFSLRRINRTAIHSTKDETGQKL